MKKRITGVLLLFILGGLLLLGGKWLLPFFKEKNQRATSDAAHTRGEIRLALDSWIGYFPLRSEEMKRRMHRAGWLLQWEDDQADYGDRMARLAEGEIDFAVVTVDSYLLNGAEYDYPGAIIMVIDESRGGDAIVAVKKKVANLDDVRNNPDLRVAFTPVSPSHHLLKAAADHFNLPGLLPVEKRLRIETQGSGEALKKLLAGTTDIGVLWEPDVSTALEKEGLVRLLGTEDTERLIVDILVVNRKFMQKNPETVALLMDTYFSVLKRFRDNPELLEKELVTEEGVNRETARSMLAGVHWVSLTENCEKWFGIAGPGGYADEDITTTIDSTAEILVSAGDFQDSPVPDHDSYRLLKRSFLEDLFLKGMSGFTTPGAADGTGMKSSLQTSFVPLDPSGWDRLQEVGTLKIEPIIFRHGSVQLDLFAREKIDSAVKRLEHYPHFRVLIKGHSGTRGNSQANHQLSQLRADSVAEYLHSRYKIDKNRLHSVGYGGDKPLRRQDGESERAYEQRLLRVELALVREEL